jgi:hypothetical protein
VGRDPVNSFARSSRREARRSNETDMLSLTMRRSISLLAVLCFLSCAVPLFAQKTPEPPKAADYEDADGYVVLSILLNDAHSEDPVFYLPLFYFLP